MITYRLQNNKKKKAMKWHLSQGAMELPPQQSASWNKLKLIILLFRSLLFRSLIYKYSILLINNIIKMTLYYKVFNI